MGAEALDIVSRMIRTEPSRRPRAHQIKSHPYFWEADCKLDFLNEFSDRVQLSIKNKERLHVAINASLTSDGQPLVGNSWEQSLHPVLIADISQHRKYDFQCISECLRMIRNKRRHVYELHADLQHLVNANMFFRYFNGLYPELLMKCVRVASRLLPDDDMLVQKYLVNVVDMFRGDDDDETDVAAANACAGGEEGGACPTSSLSATSSSGGGGMERGGGKAGGSKKNLPVKFKTEMCRNKEKCQYWKSGKCHFAHTKEEQAKALARQCQSNDKGNERVGGWGGSASANWRSGK